MQLNKILNEDGAVLRFRDLSPMQVGAIKRIASGELDIETASPQTMATIDSLQDLGLLDDAYELTVVGQKAAGFAKVGSTDRRTAAKTDSALGREGSAPKSYTGNGDFTADASDETGDAPAFRNRWEDIKDMD